MSTIKDVAKKAGVSISTVSNVLNGKVSAENEKYKLVQEAVRELNYRPNYNAQNLKKAKTKLVGVLLPDMTLPYPDIYRGICKKFEGTQHYPILKLTKNNDLLEQDMMQSFLDLGVSGIITVPSSPVPGKGCMEVEKRGVPFVAIERKLRHYDCNCVVFDNASFIYQQMSALEGRYKSDEILLIHQRGYYTSEEDCRRGFLQSSLGKEENIVIVNADRDEAFKKVYHQLMERKDRVKCVITSMFSIAQAVYEARSMLGLELDIYTLAGEEWNTCTLYNNMQVIQRDMVMAGLKAAELLMDQEQHRSDTQTFYLKRRTAQGSAGPVWFEKKKEIRVLALDSEATEVLERLSTVVETQCNLRVTYDKKSYDGLKRALDREMDSPVCNYDIVMIDKPWLPYYTSQDFLYELRKDLGRELLKQFPAEVRKSFSAYDQRRCVIPVISSMQAIYYRKDIFEDSAIKASFLGKYGIPLLVPRSWKEFNMVCRFFTREYNPDSPFMYGTAFSTADFNNLVSAFYPRQWAFGGAITDQYGDLVFSRDGNLRALNNFRETFHYCKKDSTYATKDDELFQAILKGEVPIVMGFASHYCPQKYKEQTCEHLLKAAPVPKNKSIIGGYCLGINNKSDKIQEACEYLRFMISDKISIANMRMNGCIPTYAVYHNTELRLKYPWMDLMAQAYTNGGSRDKVIASNGKQILPEALDDVLGEMLKESLETSEDSGKLLSKTEEKILKMIKYSIKTF